MRTKFLVAAAVAASAFATPAFAQDSTFSGPRAEGVVGWDHLTSSQPGSDSKDGVVYGGQIGYDHDFGSVVAGVEGEGTFSSARHTLTNVGGPANSLRTDASRDLYVGGRLGFKAGERTLIYGKVGYDNGRFGTHYTTGAATVSSNGNEDGYRVGGGAELKLNDKVYAKAEYRYTDYSDSALDRHQVVAGLGVRF